MIKLKNKGFTLVELLVAMAIISLMGMVLFKTIDSGTINNAKNSKRISAMNIAQNEIEDIKYKVSTINSENRTEILNEIEVDDEEKIIGNTTYIINVNIVNSIDVGSKKLHTVKVVVKLPEQSSDNGVGEIITRIYEN